MQVLTKAMVSALTGAEVTHHAINRVELAADLDTMTVHLDSWPNEQARIDRQAASGHAMVTLSAAALDLGDGLQAALQAAVLASDDFSGGGWAPAADGTLDEAKARKWTQVKAERLARITAPLVWDGSTFDADLQSQLVLMQAERQAAAAIAASTTFAANWTLADNTTRELDAADVVTLAAELWARTSELHVTSQTLRGEIEAADDETDLGDIEWPEE